MPSGGQWPPTPWKIGSTMKNAQKKATKNITSEAMNSSMP